MSDTAIDCTPLTDAETLDRRVSDLGAPTFMTVPPTGSAFLTFEFALMPPPPEACQIASLIRHRFLTDEQFARDLFGHLHSQGRVLQSLGHPNPLPRVGGINAPLRRRTVSR